MAVQIPLPERRLWPRQAGDQRRRRADGNIFVSAILDAYAALVAEATELDGIFPAGFVVLLLPFAGASVPPAVVIPFSNEFFPGLMRTGPSQSGRVTVRREHGP